MKATVEEINTVQKRIKVTVSLENVNKAFNSAYSKLQKKAKVHGFRPGKAPINIIKRIYGENVSYEVGEKLINEHLFSALKENEVNPIASPVVEAENNPSWNAEYSFSAVVDVMPSISLNEAYKGLEISRTEYKYDDTTVERELKLLARKYAKTTRLEDDKAIAASGHMATISHKAELGGQKLPDMDIDGALVALGQDEIFPELEKAILGMSVGSDKNVDITIPSDYQDLEIAGKSVSFHITLDDLKKLELPTLDDDFAKDLDFESMDALKESITKQLADHTENLNKQEMETKLLEGLLSKVDFEVPPAMVDQVIDSMITEIQFKDQADRTKALKDEEIRKSMRTQAKEKAQNTMALWEVIKAEGLSVSDDEVKSHIRSFSHNTAEQTDEQIESTFKSIGNRLRENMLFDKAVQFLSSEAKVSTNVETI